MNTSVECPVSVMTPEGHKSLVDESLLEFAQMFCTSPEEIQKKAKANGQTIVDLITEYTKVQLQSV